MISRRLPGADSASASGPQLNADEVCPVCGRPAPGGGSCERCHDLRAAARAAAAIVPPDKVLLALLAEAARGGLQPRQIEQAMATDGGEEPPRMPSAGIMFALTRLVTGKTGAIAFVEIGPDTVSLQTLVVDSFGVPDRLPGEICEWTRIVPSLPRRLGLRYLRMAGGVGRTAAKGEDFDPGALAEAVGSGIAAALERFDAAAAQAAASFRADCEPNGPGNASSVLDRVLVHRTQNWPLLEAAAARARGVLHPVTEIMAVPGPGTLADIVDEIAAGTPLRYGYDLIAVDVEKRTVSPRPHELFPPGAAVPLGSLRAVTVTVSPVKGYSAERVSLPIVIRRGAVADLRDAAALEKHRRLVAMAEFDSAVARPFRVRVELPRPGRVQMLTPQEVLLADARPGDWPGTMAHLPERLETRAQLPGGSLDLVLLVELGGTADTVGARLGLVRGVVRQFRGAANARLAVLGYRDHFRGHEWDKSLEPGQEMRSLIVGGSNRGFGPPDALQRMLDRADWWRAVEVRDDNAAPVEDALWLLAHHWNWQPGARHLALIVGGRPPHPIPHSRARVVTCPRDWRAALERLRVSQALECFAVLDDNPESGYAESTWRALTASGGLRTAGRRTTAAVLAQDCGLAPRSRVRVPLATVHGTDTLPAPGLESAR